ncbi:MAG TPA: adenylate/guanylate cyclase domain-containing protein [Candidatus Acidoferrales bacterium]|nr:adenylate/guanylate cyclase domain-containing protein [Candidatus Acidoferrales bacterium]
MTEEQRKLAAIVFTDIVGYTAQSQRDEKHALLLLRKHNELLRSQIPKFKGREIKTMGDSFLLEFDSALDALNYAIKVQDRLQEYNLAVNDEDRINIRIGIHVGDVVHHGTDLLGDAVNIASRIEPLASPGGICVSQQVYDQVWNKGNFRITQIATPKLKNVNQPIVLYKVEARPTELGETERMTELDHLRVAVLPFSNISPDPNDEYFADGMTEELITNLSGISGLTVIARTSVMPYKTMGKRITEIGRELRAGTIIEGSVRKAANKVRISVQAVDAESEGHLWARTYENELNDVFAVQSEIAEKVAENLRVKLLESEKQKLKTTPTENSEAHTLYLKGRYYWNLRTKDAITRAIQYFELAVKSDPQFALGYTALAECYSVMARNGLADPVIAYQKDKEYLMKALEFNENSAEARADYAAYLYYHELKPREAESEFKRAIELNPNNATAHQWYAHLLGATNRVHEAFTHIKRAQELDPLSRAINLNVGDGLYYLKEYDKAIEQFKKVIELDPKYDAVYPSLVQVYLRKAMYEDALKAAEKYSELSGKPLEAKLMKANILASMGKKQESRGLLGQVKAGFKDEILSPYHVSIVHFALGDVDEGFEWLDRAYNDHDPNITLMNCDVEFEAVKSDPRFHKLLEKTGLGT